MPGTVITGLHWGDEGKGKIVDFLSRESDVVVRFQGGNNAGHSVVFNGARFALHVLPSGIFHPKTMSIIGPGVVVDPGVLCQEIAGMKEKGFDVAGKLIVSNRAHIIMPHHKSLDSLDGSGGAFIGTTHRGIGPCYSDKMSRAGLRVGDLLNADVFRRKASSAVKEAARRMLLVLNQSTPSADAVIEEYLAYGEKLRPYIADSTTYIHEAIRQNKKVLFEGAQGTLLDIDHGTYPYVTSSNSCSLGVCAGAGVSPLHINRIIGVMKAYCSRVGQGPFPTELENEDGEKIRTRGNEYGTTTKRPRRCGWFDAVAAGYSVRLNGCAECALMLLDVLSTFKKIRICRAYELDGREITEFPADADDLRRSKPVYEELDGWDEDITGARKFEELPTAAQKYVRRLEELLGAKMSLISIGPDREQVIRR